MMFWIFWDFVMGKENIYIQYAGVGKTDWMRASSMGNKHE